MNKKGLTLVELLAVLVIIGIISIIAISVVTDKINLSKRKTYDIEVDNIISAAKNYMLNEDNLDVNHTNTLCIYVSDLQDKEFIKKGKIVNPLTNEDIAKKVNNKSKGVVIVKFDEDSNQYKYEFTTEGCTEVIVTPAYKTILENEEIKSIGNSDGLYETNDEYIFKGTSPKNYINFNGTTWRIISIDKQTNMLKIINLSDNLKSLSDDGVDGIVDEMNIELLDENNSYKNVLPKISMNSKWNKGNVSSLDTALSIKSLEKQSNDYKTITLLTLGEYIDSSVDKDCYKDVCTSYLSTEKNFWLINKNDNKNWYVKSDKSLDSVVPDDQLYHFYPVLYLKASAEIESGNGTSTQPYVLK